MVLDVDHAGQGPAVAGLAQYALEAVGVEKTKVGGSAKAARSSAARASTASDSFSPMIGVAWASTERRKLAWESRAPGLAIGPVHRHPALERPAYRVQRAQRRAEGRKPGGGIVIRIAVDEIQDDVARQPVGESPQACRVGVAIPLRLSRSYAGFRLLQRAP